MAFLHSLKKNVQVPDISVTGIKNKLGCHRVCRVYRGMMKGEMFREGGDTYNMPVSDISVTRIDN